MIIRVTHDEGHHDRRSVSDYWMHDARIQGLSGDHFRALMHALAWCAANRTDGLIRTENSIADSADRGGAVYAPRGCRAMWVELDDGLADRRLPGNADQPRAQFEGNDRTRAADRERKAKQRAERAERFAAAQQGVHTDVLPDVRSERIGRQAGRHVFSNPTNYVNSEPRTFDDEPPDDDEPPPEEPELAQQGTERVAAREFLRNTARVLTRTSTCRDYDAAIRRNTDPDVGPMTGDRLDSRWVRTVYAACRCRRGIPLCVLPKHGRRPAPPTAQVPRGTLERPESTAAGCAWESRLSSAPGWSSRRRNQNHDRRDERCMTR